MRNSMMFLSALVALSMGLTAVATSIRAASTESDYKTAFAAAESANNEAGKLRNQWTTAVTALSDAKKAADAGDFDKAVAGARKHLKCCRRRRSFRPTSKRTHGKRWRSAKREFPHVDARDICVEDPLRALARE